MDIPRGQTQTSPTINVSQTERLGSVVGGAGLLLYALQRRDQLGGLLGALSALLLYRGIVGHSFVYRLLGINTAVRAGDQPAVSVPHKQGIRVTKSVVINRPVDEVYRYWRDLENLPNFMRHLESVEELDEKRSHWVAKAPAGMQVEWDAEIVNEVPNSVIGWRSVANSQIANAGSVRFRRIHGESSTQVDVSLEYVPPAGVAGDIVARLFGEAPQQQVDEDLRRFKHIMEASDVSTAAGRASSAHSKQAPAG